MGGPEFVDVNPEDLELKNGELYDPVSGKWVVENPLHPGSYMESGYSQAQREREEYEDYLAEEREKKRKAEMEREPERTGPDMLDRTLGNLGQTVKDSFHDTNKKFAQGLGIFAIVGVGAMLFHDILGNPGDIMGGIKKTLYRLHGIVGYILTGFAWIILRLLFSGVENEIATVVLTVFEIVLLFRMIGYTRMVFLKPFFPDLRRFKRVPWYVNIGIVVATVYLVMKTVIDSADAYLINHGIEVTDEIAIKTLAGSFAGSLLCGLFLCWVCKTILKASKRVYSK